VVGLTPAERQRDFIMAQARERGLADRVEIRLGHFERTDFTAGAFDAVTMLGSIVHMPDLAGAYRRCRELLRRDGRLYVSESCFRNAAKHRQFAEREGTTFVRDSIFGWGDMRPLSDLVRAAEDAELSITAVEDLTDHYRRTIDDWMANVRENAAAIDARDPGASARLTHYLEIANAGWGYTTKHYALVCRRGR
jgi:cyclopropane-fatty-acyl-phospholipid synthase